jgi:AcrR family transcriptional regulator
MSSTTTRETRGDKARDGAGSAGPAARERLLAAAEELFYAEGVHTVGIDRVIERAGVAKATLYNTFGSKDELVRAYLIRHNQAWRERLAGQLAERYHTPREKLLGVFDLQGERFAGPGFHGCAFARASAEAPPGSSIVGVSDESRAWVADLFTGLARQAGAADPQALGRQLALLYHAATQSAQLDHDPAAATVARAAATTLLDAATSAQPGSPAGR